jgi:hypothetical protein
MIPGQVVITFKTAANETVSVNASSIPIREASGWLYLGQRFRCQVPRTIVSHLWDAEATGSTVLRFGVSTNSSAPVVVEIPLRTRSSMHVVMHSSTSYALQEKLPVAVVLCATMMNRRGLRFRICVSV